jgi:hypothetical protein
MWYKYLNRTQPYLRQYRTSNLWFDQFRPIARVTKHQGMHAMFIRRFTKTYSGVTNKIPNILLIHLFYNRQDGLHSFLAVL